MRAGRDRPPGARAHGRGLVRTRQGVRAAGLPAPLALQGGTAVAPGDIARFEVRTLGDDRTLLTVPA
ncbi:hypothetical protein ACFQHO_39460 [Actinomadura yumaensis]|uniref:hypothetical protein n=1 Tax=Actinomadura yumaensis TaxID=111807 RepID=UPI003608AF9F